MSGKDRISEAVIRRLPRYYQHLKELEAQGCTRISSYKISQAMGLTASQIRQDFNCFGGFGQQGYGYNVTALKGQIAHILGVDRPQSLIIVGAGNIGQALARYEGFKREGYEVKALFDVAEPLVGTHVGGMEVLHLSTLESFAREHPADIGVLAVPAAHAQATAERLAACDIGGIWNFTPIDVKVQNVTVENVRLSDSLHVLSYFMSAGAAERRDNRGRPNA